MEPTVSYLLMLQKHINSKDFTTNKMTKTESKGVINFFSVDFNCVNTNDILDIHRYLIKRKRHKLIFGLVKKIFIGLLTRLINGHNHTKCFWLSCHECQIQATLINLNTAKNSTTNEYSQEFHYYPFVVKLDRFAGNCNTLNDKV